MNKRKFLLALVATAATPAMANAKPAVRMPPAGAWELRLKDDPQSREDFYAASIMNGVIPPGIKRGVGNFFARRFEVFCEFANEHREYTAEELAAILGERADAVHSVRPGRRFKLPNGKWSQQYLCNTCLPQKRRRVT